MTHVSKTHALLLLSVIGRSLSVQDALSDIGLRSQVGAVGVAEEVNGQGAVIAAFEAAIKHLLNHIVYNVVEEVVPREAEEEILRNKYGNPYQKWKENSQGS